MAGSDAQSFSPIFDVDEGKDVKVFYHNVAYKATRMAVNVEKMKVCQMHEAAAQRPRQAGILVICCCCCCRS